MKMEKNKLKTTIYALSILIVFVSFIQVTISPVFDNNLEYPNYNCTKHINLTENQQIACNNDFDNKVKEYNEKYSEIKLHRFYASIILSLITLLIISFVKFKDAINYGLFSGLSVNILYSLIYVQKSYISILILFSLLIGIIYYINKDKSE